MTPPPWADSPIHDMIREAGLDNCERTASGPSDATACSALTDAEKYARPCDGASIFRVEEQLRIAMDGHPDSELWGEHGLIAATMRCVVAVGKIEDLVTTDHETKEAFIQRVRSIISLPNS